jgi:predicted RNA-binding protein with TRAM domain
VGASVLDTGVLGFFLAQNKEYADWGIGTMSAQEKKKRGSRKFPKPVRRGEEYSVSIEEVSRLGDGVARIKRFVIFVPGTKPGDQVRIKIMRVFDRFAIAEVVER